MNLNQLRFASELASAASFSRAAQRCNVTQPTLSNAIARLEDELGARIFERTTRRVVLTAFGRQMLPRIEQVLDAIADLEVSAQNFFEPDVKLLRIGLSPIINMDRLAQIIEPYCRSHPTVRIIYKQCYLADLEERLRAGQVDVGLWPQATNGNEFTDLSSIDLYDEPLMFLPGSETTVRSADKKEITVQSLKKETLVLTPDICGLARVTKSLFHEANVELNEYPGHALSYDVMQEWADLGLGSAILPVSKLTADRMKRVMPIVAAKKRQERVKLVASWKTESNSPNHIREFRKHLQRG